jgi:hypothetical protein
MTQGMIYMVDGTGLRRMSPSAPESEDRMQSLVASYPELISDGDGELLLIRRELAVSDGEDAGRWSLDHLFVTREAIPVLVELKRAVDTRLRREVVGQMLDYAANAGAHWRAGSMAESFGKTAGDAAETVLSNFIGDKDPQVFWEQAESNLQSGKIKLVFVADAIPRELARIVEFLNDQMRAEVRAVELQWFAGEGITTLAPRVIGETERTAAAKRDGLQPRMEVSQWIDERIVRHGPETVTGVQRLTEIVRRAGGDVFIPLTRGSIMYWFTAEESKKLYPVGVYPSGMVVLRLGYLKNRPAFSEESARRRLYDDLVTLVGPLHTTSLSGEPGFRASLLADEAVAERFTHYLENVIEQGRGS